MRRRKLRRLVGPRPDRVGPTLGGGSDSLARVASPAAAAARLEAGT